MKNVLIKTKNKLHIEKNKGEILYKGVSKGFIGIFYSIETVKRKVLFSSIL